MRGCQLVRDGDRLTIRPTFGTVGAPRLACVILGGGLVFGVVRLVQLPAADITELFDQPMTWFYAILNLTLFGAAVAWYRVASRAIVLDKQTNTLEIGGRRESLAGAVAVAVNVSSSSDSDSFYVELVFIDRRLRIGRTGWTDETNRAVADQKAAQIAEFLGLSVGLALAS